MDKDRRDQVDSEIRERLLSQQRIHIEELELLEQAYDFDLDAYTDVYGRVSIDGTRKDALEIKNNWAELLHSLKASPFTVLVRTRRNLKPGCYGFGAEAKYELQAEVILVKGQADIVGDRVDDETSLCIIGAEVFRLEGHAFVHEPTQMLASSSDYSRENIANGSALHHRIMSDDTRVISVNEVAEVQSGIRRTISNETADSFDFMDRLFTALNSLKSLEIAE